MERHADLSFNALTHSDLRVKVVDVGANPIDGSPPYATMLFAGEADVVGFEPNPQALATLQEMKGPNETYLPHAVGDGAQHTLHICQAPGMTSLFQPNPEVLTLFHGFPDWGRVVATCPVDTVRLDDVDATRGADLLKLDVQGAELMVLSHATDRLRDALVIQAEVEFLPMYVDQPLFADVESFLRRQGFMFHRFYPQTSRVIRPLMVNNDIFAGMSQVFWADAIFVRDITRLAAWSDRALLATAKLMHDCYRSIDLALHLLAEHARRTGEPVASVYGESLPRLI